jgi:hypothetical protein
MAAGGGPPPEDVPPGDASEDGSPTIGPEAGSSDDASRGRDNRTSIVRRGARTNTHGSAASGCCARGLRSDPVREA